MTLPLDLACPALAADLGLEVPEGFWQRVSVHTRQAGAFVVETVTTMRLATPETVARYEAAAARGELLAADLTEHSRPLPWLSLGDGLVLLRARSWRGQALEVGRTQDGRETRRALPPTGPVWVWEAGRVVLEGVEGARERDLRAMLPGLTALRRVVSDARPGRPEKYGSELAEALRAERAAMSARVRRRVSWAEVGARHGLDRRRVSDMLKKYPPE